ncbi:hypothetical protein [Pseudonocardia alaniniphila]|uniref:MftR C-terminal domain-containing protein n=1 Tax=Pseudonocardia alaniniphila TaxID=75291 RepID=A0ABS9T8P5_9PSEU|nr:hypothetical protein [Pseudonocardia alaniniphila]MCH6164899.1 hypothetical protein [Pseudonocardia alaniniphila]
MTQAGQPYSSVEDEQARAMRAAADRASLIPGIPWPIWAAIGHVLFAVATELANGRRLPIEVRRAALHMVRAIDEAEARR